MFMPRTDFFLLMQSSCGINNRTPDWILRTIVSPQLTRADKWEPFFVATWSEMFMPRTGFFMQSPCGINGRTSDWILSTKVSPQLTWKRTNENPSLPATANTRSEMFMPGTDFFLLMQSSCGINSQTPDWILRTKVSPQLTRERTNESPSLSQLKARCLCRTVFYAISLWD
jgi:hypothetical protein